MFTHQSSEKIQTFHSHVHDGDERFMEEFNLINEHPDGRGSQCFPKRARGGQAEHQARDRIMANFFKKKVGGQVATSGVQMSDVS